MRRSASAGSIKSQSLSLDGAMPPSRKDGWANFQAWTEQWNRFFATLFCILAFALLFAIVVVNVINAERESDRPEGGTYSAEKTTGKPEELNEIGSATSEDQTSDHFNGPQLVFDLIDVRNSKSEGFIVKEATPEEIIPENDCAMTTHCSFLCKSMMSSEVNAIINRLLEEVYCTRYNIRLEEINFTDKKIRKAWLSLPKGLRFLEILNSNLETIEPDTFNDRQYDQLTDLRFGKLQIKELVANTFSGLTVLEYLELRELPIEVVSPNILDPLARQLKTLLLYGNLVPIDPHKFTGSVNLVNLESLAMQNNNIGDTINKKTFKNLPKLINLTFNDNNITNLTNDAFDSIGRQLRVMRLDGNSLKTVPKGLLSRIKSKQFRILLERNPWNCDCDLLELQYHMRVNSEWFSDDPVCATPLYLSGKLIRTAQFCVATERPSITEETTSTTVDSETTTTTVIDCVTERESDTTTDYYQPTKRTTETTPSEATTPEYITSTTEVMTTITYPTTYPTHPRTSPTMLPTTEVPHNCSTINREPICGGDRYSAHCQLPHHSVVERNRWQRSGTTEKVQVEAPSFKIKIKEIERFKVEIHVSRRYVGFDKYFILWFADENTEVGLISNDKLLADCQCSQQQDVYVQELPPSTTYIFCVMVQRNHKNSNIDYDGYDGYVNSPFDCLPYKTMPPKSEEAWLTYDDRWVVTSLTLLILMCCGVVGALTMYFIIRRMPTLLRGSERVVIVNNNQVKVYGNKSLKKSDSVISSNIASIQSRPLPDIQQSTYLTPIPRKMSIYKKNLVGSRRASDTSIDSVKMAQKTSCYCAVKDKQCFYDLKDVPKTPPPLPNRASIQSEYINIVRSPENEIYTEFSYENSGYQENIYSKTEVDCNIETL